jgi:hypothetical protein
MSRLPCRRNTVLAALSILLASWLGVLGFTTFRTGYFVSRGVGDAYSTHPGQFFLMVNRGSLSGGWQSTFTAPAHWQAYPIDPYPQGRFGFAAYFSSGSKTVGIPLWQLAGIAVVCSLSLWRRVERPGPNLCVRCGYDLRATPDRCPECGQVPTATTTTAAG